MTDDGVCVTGTAAARRTRLCSHDPLPPAADDEQEEDEVRCILCINPAAAVAADEGEKGLTFATRGVR